MKFKNLPIYIFLGIIFLFAVLPMIWLFLAAFDPAATQATEIPEPPTLSNFHKALSGRSFRWTLNSLLIAGVTATLVLIICSLAAYPLSRLHFPGANVILFGSVLLRIIPPSTFILPVYIIMARLGLLNTYVGVIIILTTLGLPFPLLLMKGFYDTIPREFEEAAWVDGCGRIKSIFLVLLPQCGPGIAVVWFMTFIFAWGQFQIPLILLRKMEMMPLSVGLFSAYGEHGVINFGFLSALSLIYALPPVIIYFFIRKYMVKGMAGYTK